LRVFPDWQFRGLTVGYTGANLAERILGSRTEANRKTMLDIQFDVYFKSFPQILNLQRKLTEFYNDKDTFLFPSGRILDFYGPDVEDFKLILAATGQGGGADYIQAGMVELVSRDAHALPVMQVHDEVDCYFPTEYSDSTIVTVLRAMCEEHSVLPGLKAPIKILRGKNWKEKEMRVLGKFS
jgi:DNA polymerase I-like protein with 3'-5' exonuclease and polymerase domains